MYTVRKYFFLYFYDKPTIGTNYKNHYVSLYIATII